MQSCPFVCLCGCCRDPGLWSVSRCSLQLHRLLCLQQTWKVWTPTLLAALMHPRIAAHPQAPRRSSAVCRIPPASSNFPLTTLSFPLMLTRVSLLHLRPSGTICEKVGAPASVHSCVGVVLITSVFFCLLFCEIHTSYDATARSLLTVAVRPS